MRGANYFKTFLLFALMTALLLAAGHVIGGPETIVPMLFVAGGVNLVTWWFSDRIVLSMHRAQPLRPGELPWLEAAVERLAARAGIPRPALYVVPSPQPNAFAVGPSYKRSAIAVNVGLLEILSPREAEGVIAHELAHIKNRDTLIMTVAGVVAGVFSYLAHIGPWMMAGRDSEGRGGNPLLAILIGVVGGIAATLIQLAISRSREFGADASGAALCGDPHALADALEKLERGARRVGPVEVNEGTAHLMIVNPLRGSRLAGLFATHPPVEERVRRLRHGRSPAAAPAWAR